jgi:uncharacterized cupin superfamily protein
MATSYTNRLGTSPEEGIKAPCVVETTENITLSGAQTINSVVVVAGNRVLVKDQTDATENGIYDAAAGAWTRATDWNNAEDVISGVLVGISSNGNIYQGTWSGTFTVDTTEPSFSVTNLSDQYDVSNYILDTGAADAYVATLSPAWTAYTTGGGLYFKAANASTGASTLNVNALGEKDIKKRNDQDIEAGDIEVGGIYHVRYDGTNFQMMSPISGITATTAEINVLDGIAATLTASELSILDGVTSTTAELNILDGVTSTAAEINLLDGITAGTVSAGLALVVDSNKDLSTVRYLTATRFDDGTADLEAGTLDNATISANCTLADGVVATTQTANDNSTKVATTAYADAQASSASQNSNYILETGAADAYVAVLSPAWTAYTTGDGLTIKVGAGNTSTGASTLNVNSLGVKDIKKRNDQDIEAGDLEAGGIYSFRYDGTNFQLQTPSSSVSETVETVTTTNVITADENGKTFILSLAGGFESTLPTPAAGLHFKFIVGVAPTTAYTIVTESSSNIIHGQVCTPEDAAGSVATVASADTITFVANLAIIGDYVKVVSDGTSWFLSGMCSVQDGITTTQAP